MNVITRDELKAKRNARPREDWRDDLITKENKDGDIEVICRAHNLILILKNHEQFKGRIALNEFSGQLAVDKEDIVEATPIMIKAELENGHIHEKISTGEVLDAMCVVGQMNSFNPVKDYLTGLVWDGTPRFDKFLLALTAPVDDYHKAAIRYFFVSAVMRVFKPACQVDMMIILESLQGMGKSRLFKILFGEWYAELTESINHKDFFMALRGLWGADFGELDQFSKADATRIKQVLTIKEDNYRPAYARLTRKFPRQCIFIGGTNRDDWNRDETGGRRFLPIKVSGQIIIEWVEEHRDKLWAEAVEVMRQVEREHIEWWDIPDAQEHQDARYIGDSWEEDVKQYLLTRSQVTTSDILIGALGIEDRAKHTKREEMRVGAIMRQLPEWEKTRLHGGKRVFIRKT